MERLLLFLNVLLLVAGIVTADTCPGGHERCPDFMTCCKLANDDFGCCPFPDAKCCPDRIHCCPHNMECDVTHQSCMKNGSPVQFYWRVPIQPEIVEPVVGEGTARHQNSEVNDLQQFSRNENKCPDASHCYSSFTCCKMYSGKYGCCPFDNGTCCVDGFHCCPHGSRCSASGECYSIEMNYTVSAYPLKDTKYEKLMKTQRKQEKLARQDVSDPGGKCPDGKPCPETHTCCKITGERYGCCPYTEARCCDDGIHCCPKGTNCNITLGTCDIQKNFGWSIPSQTLVNLQWSETPNHIELSNHFQEAVLEDVICPDERYRCPPDSTCCQLGSGAYGCCPLIKATCCSDKEHCCPHDYVCVADGCRKGTHHLPPFIRTAAAARAEIQVESKDITKVDASEEVSDVICPDQYQCPDDNTCCPLESGEYGCCPMEEATCCPDKIHCCPHDYRCITDGCKKNAGSNWILPNFLSAIAIRRESKPKIVEEHREAVDDDEEVVCPDLMSFCPDGSTCCELASGLYGCCPLEDATCCGDKEHCCPHGYWCTDDGCDRMSGMPHHLAPFLHKLSSAKEIMGNQRIIHSAMLLP